MENPPIARKETIKLQCAEERSRGLGSKIEKHFTGTLFESRYGNSFLLE
jgi:hypothetical protein